MWSSSAKQRKTSISINDDVIARHLVQPDASRIDARERGDVSEISYRAVSRRVVSCRVVSRRIASRYFASQRAALG